MSDGLIDEPLDNEENEEQELFEHYRFEVDPGQEALRIDKFLMSRIMNATRNKIQQAAKAGNVLVNEQVVKPNYKVRPNDIITIVLTYPPRDTTIYGEEIPLDIVYEDQDLIIINKQAGLVVHPGHGNYSGTLINALIYRFDNLPNNSSDRPGLVHRIDKDTSGLLVIAKTEQAMAHLSLQFAEKTSEREYVALVWGNVENEEGTIEGNIGRHPKNRLQNTVYFGDDEDIYNVKGSLKKAR